MALFREYVGIDYSGAGLPADHIPGIQVCGADQRSIRMQSPADSTHQNWSRSDLAEWLATRLRDQVCRIVGIDHAFSFPEEYFNRYSLKNWDDFLRHFVKKYDTRKHRTSVVIPDIGRDGWRKQLRLTEKFTSNAKSVFEFRGPGVAHSTFAGLPWLHDLREALGDTVHFWPFDGWIPPQNKSVICEVYPALFVRRYPTGADMNSHERDARAVATWLRERDEHDLLRPHLTPHLLECERQVASVEGWILGVM